MTVGSSAASFMFLRSAAGGKIGQPFMVRPLRSTIGSVVGRCADYASFVRYPDADGARRRPGHRQYDSQGSPLGGGRKRGAEAQAIGRSRVGRTTKIHAIVDSCGRSIALEVTPGQLGDVRVALALISAVPPGRRLACDAAYDSDGLRRLLIERGILPVIPNNPTRKRPHPFDEDAYRHLSDVSAFETALGFQVGRISGSS
jgi:transposase